MIFYIFNKVINRFPKDSNFHVPLHIGFNTSLRAAEDVDLLGIV
ncbi:hypothetical protein [Clostridium botulinum]|nr:hypothetical protein [Clostridium botulinum]